MALAIGPQIRLIESPADAEMLDWLRALRLHARTPSSGYKVAAILSVPYRGQLLCFGGVNTEYFDHRLGTHGEESAIAAIFTALGKSIRVNGCWTVGAPDFLTEPCDHVQAKMPGYCCGNCRQQLSELMDRKAKIFNYSLNGACVESSLDEIFPHAFTFANIDLESAADQAAAQSKTITLDLPEIERRLVRAEKQSEEDIKHWLQSLESVDYCSRTSQAVVLELDNGYTVAGVNVENAVLTGLNAAQSACSIANAALGTGWKIRRAFVFSQNRRKVLVENEIMPLTLSALQTLNEWAADHNVDVTHFSVTGQKFTLALQKWADWVPSKDHDIFCFQDGVLRAA